MNCTECKTINDADALFCAGCGRPLAPEPAKPVRSQRRTYLIALLFVPVIAIAAAVGWYKFFLPDGVAAVVNGEEITLSELDAAVVRMSGPRGAPAAGLRHQALNELIAERLVLQEARKAGIRVSGEEVARAAAQAQAASGLDDAAFKREMTALYGSMSGYEDAMERRLVIHRLIAERVVPPGADPQTSGRAMNQWLRGLSSKAAVRITLAEQVSGPGCACCGTSGGPGRGRGGAGAAGTAAASDQTKAAADAVLRYWHAKHGPDAVTAQSIDYGCHVQVDIVKNERVIGSLRYQDGNVSEM